MAPEITRMFATLLATGAGVWVGGLVTVTLVVVSRKAIDAERVVLFRSFGRMFAIFFSVTAIFVVVPAVFLAVNTSQVLAISVALLAIGLLIATAFGILQARRMTVMRTALASGLVSEALVRRNAIIAGNIRALLVLGYVALLVMAVPLASTI